VLIIAGVRHRGRLPWKQLQLVVPYTPMSGPVQSTPSRKLVVVAMKCNVPVVV
jgi:hypothetical protein